MLRAYLRRWLGCAADEAQLQALRDQLDALTRYQDVQGSTIARLQHRIERLEPKQEARISLSKRSFDPHLGTR